MCTGSTGIWTGILVGFRTYSEIQRITYLDSNNLANRVHRRYGSFSERRPDRDKSGSLWKGIPYPLVALTRQLSPGSGSGDRFGPGSFGRPERPGPRLSGRAGLRSGRCTRNVHMSGLKSTTLHKTRQDKSVGECGTDQ